MESDGFVPSSPSNGKSWMDDITMETGLQGLGEAVWTHKQMGGNHDSIFLGIKAGVISSGKG